MSDVALHEAPPQATELALTDDAATCDQCRNPFTKRAGTGGKPQRFCSPECRSAFHASDSQRGRSHVGASPPAGAIQPTAQTPISSRPEAGGSYEPPGADDADFDWSNDDAVILREQPATAVYFNKYHALVIRQQRDWDRDDDMFVYIAPSNMQQFLNAVCDALGIKRFS